MNGAQSINEIERRCKDAIAHCRAREIAEAQSDRDRLRADAKAELSLNLLPANVQMVELMARTGDSELVNDVFATVLHQHLLALFLNTRSLSGLIDLMARIASTAANAPDIMAGYVRTDGGYEAIRAELKRGIS